MIYISKTKSVIIFAMCMIETFLFSNMIYGFNSLSSTFKNIGVFSELCLDDNSINGNHTNKSSISFKTCSSQDVYYGNAFLSWIILQAVASTFIGLFYDKIGMRFTKVIAASLFGMGCFLFALTRLSSWALFPAGVLTAISGYCLNLVVVGVSELFPNHRNLFLSILSGLRRGSSVVFNLFKLIFDSGVPLSISFSSFGIFGFSFMTLTAIFIMKKTADLMGTNQKMIEKDLEEVTVTKTEDIKERNEDFLIKDNALEENVESIEIEENENIDLVKNKLKVLQQRNDYLSESYPTIWKALFSRKFIFNMIFFAFVNNRFVFFLSQMGSQLNYLFPNNKEVVNHLQFISSFFSVIGFIISIGAGVFLDRIQERTNSKVVTIAQNKGISKVSKSLDRVYVPGLMISVLSGLFGSFLVGVPNVYVYYLVFLCFYISKSFSSPALGSFISKSFPKEFCGTLMGVTVSATGIINLTLVPLLHYAKADAYPQLINYLIMSYSIITLAHPVSLMTF